ncbi:MAG: hypothetical protein HFF65_12090 [Oscillospiraceae bacterium]|nr:hypothetical protein [Oscillospiraceae bacterium]
MATTKAAQIKLRPAQFYLVSRKIRFTYCADVAEKISATLLMWSAKKFRSSPC